MCVWFQGSLLTLLDKLYQAVPFSKLQPSDQIYTHKQVLALTWACKLGRDDCIEEVNKQFKEYKDKDEK